MVPLLLFLLYSASATSEWVGSLRVLNSTNEYHNITLLHDSPVTVRAYFSLVSTNETLNATTSMPPLVRITQLLLTEVDNDTSVEESLLLCKDLNANFTLMVTDVNITYPQVQDANVTVFTIPSTEGHRLKSELAGSSDPITVYLTYLFNCES